jgi:GTP-binding protein HflX
VIVVFNKIDAYRPADHDPDDLAPKRLDQYTLEELKATWMARMSGDDIIFISAAQRINIDGLRKLLYDRVKAIHTARYPYESDLLFKDHYEEE